MPEIPRKHATETRLSRVNSYSTDKLSKRNTDSQTPLNAYDIKRELNKISEFLCNPAHVKEGPGTIPKFFELGSEVLAAQASGGRNILHMVIEDYPTEYAQNTPAHMRRFLQQLIIEHPEVLNQRDEDGKTPLDKAARKGKRIFFLLMDHIMPEEKIMDLKKGDWRETVRDPHTTERLEQIAEYFQRQDCSDLRKGTSDSCHTRSLGDTGTNAESTDHDEDHVRSLNGEAPDSNICAQDSFNHLDSRSQVQMSLDTARLDEWVGTLRSYLESALSMEGEVNKISCLHMLLRDENSFQVSLEASSDPPRLISNFGRLIAMCPKNIFITLDSQNGYTPLHQAVKLYQHDQIDYESINEVIRQLVKAAPNTIYSNCGLMKEKEALTPYRLLKKTWDKRHSKPGKLIQECYSDLEKFLKSAVIGDQCSWDEKTKYLYGGPNGARKIFFDLQGVNERVDEEYIKNLEERVNLDFEAALEYVCLPEHYAAESHKSHESQNQSRSNRFEDSSENKCDPYVKIFDWLAETKKVEKIFRLVVDDMGTNPHSDDGIRNALTIPIDSESKRDDKPWRLERLKSLPQSRFKIEVWDWRRLDICSETIAAAAPDVRELYLYSSGNPAVFRGWGCKYGLAKLQKLQSIKIKVFSRKGGDNACAEAFENFRTKFCRRCDIKEENVRIEYANHCAAGQQSDGDLKTPNSNEHIDPAWFKKLAPFTEFLQDKFEEKATVKIALLDDGIDSTHPDLGNIKDGVSFYPKNNEETRFRDYFTGPSEHGTRMGMCIRKVCPMAQLYVARLDHSMSGREKFTVESAKKAVKWATSMGVDIISMSWSFHKDDAPSENELNEFKYAIAEAKKQRILLFGSMTDVQDVPTLEDYFPLSLNDVITIGSADDCGGKMKNGAGRTSNYLFPGQNITLPNTKGKRIDVSGSSLATAFAAGLSGLVLFTLQIHYQVNAEKVEENDKIRLTNVVKTSEGMSKIFDVLGDRPAGAVEKDLYVGLGKIFPQDKGKFKDYPSTLEALIGKICERC